MNAIDPDDLLTAVHKFAQAKFDQGVFEGQKRFDPNLAKDTNYYSGMGNANYRGNIAESEVEKMLGIERPDPDYGVPDDWPEWLLVDRARFERLLELARAFRNASNAEDSDLIVASSALQDSDLDPIP